MPIIIKVLGLYAQDLEEKDYKFILTYSKRLCPLFKGGTIVYNESMEIHFCTQLEDLGHTVEECLRKRFSLSSLLLRKIKRTGGVFCSLNDYEKGKHLLQQHQYLTAKQSSKLLLSDEISPNQESTDEKENSSTARNSLNTFLATRKKEEYQDFFRLFTEQERSKAKPLVCPAEKYAFRMTDRIFFPLTLNIIWNEEESSYQKKLLSEPSIALLYEDDWLAVANKPPFLLTHPSYKNKGDSLITRLSPYTLHPISRLDRDTSGLVLLGKCGFAQDSIRKKPLQKVYHLFCHGLVEEDEGLLSFPIQREENSIILRKIAPEGQKALTRFQVLQRFPKANITYVRCELLTGRTHQIRLHFLHFAHPLVGESLYGLERCLPYTDFFDTRKEEQKFIPYTKKTQTIEENMQKKEDDLVNKNLPFFTYLKEKQQKHLARKLLSLEKEEWENYQGSYLLPPHLLGDYADKFAEKHRNFDWERAYFWDIKLARQALHAYSLSFYHPISQKEIYLEASLPQDLALLHRTLEKE